jgi:hypothetical protein
MSDVESPMPDNATHSTASDLTWARAHEIVCNVRDRYPRYAADAPSEEIVDALVAAGLISLEVSTQQATVARLNALSRPSRQVDAGPLDEDADEPCQDDYAHGPGTVWVRDQLLCPDCAVELVRWLVQEPGDNIALDVLR